MNQPIVIVNDSFQEVWKSILINLRDNKWEQYNVIAQIVNPQLLDLQFHHQYDCFCKENDIKTPKDVAYTIFPYKLARKYHSPDELFHAYNTRFISFLKKRPHFGWGTYFQRMTDYYSDGTVNQLEKVINAINTRDKISKAALTIIIQKPGGETIKPLGGPCLNYISVQTQKTNNNEVEMSLLCVYRNHDFLERAYGNYWGLSNLLLYIAEKTNLRVGTVTCVSSHAYIDKKKTALKRFMENFI